MPAINNSDEDMSETERLLQNPVLDTDESSGGHAPSIRGPSDRFAFSLFCFHNVLLFPSQIFYLPVMLVQPIVSLLNMLKIMLYTRYSVSGLALTNAVGLSAAVCRVFGIAARTRCSYFQLAHAATA
jgi:hypothetical protein